MNGTNVREPEPGGNMKKIKYGLLVLAFCGCSSVALNKSPAEKYEEIAGRTFKYPKKDVFNACLTSLRSNGWTVTGSDYGAGSISGIRREDRGAPSDADLVQQTAAVSVIEVLPGQTEVKITSGLRYRDPGGAAAGAGKMPEACVPILNGTRKALLKSRRGAVK